jgi:hypothetical protein
MQILMTGIHVSQIKPFSGLGNNEKTWNSLMEMAKLSIIPSYAPNIGEKE